MMWNKNKILRRKRNKLSLTGRMCYLFMCIEKYFITLDPQKYVVFCIAIVTKFLLSPCDDASNVAVFWVVYPLFLLVNLIPVLTLSLQEMLYLLQCLGWRRCCLCFSLIYEVKLLFMKNNKFYFFALFAIQRERQLSKYGGLFFEKE